MKQRISALDLQLLTTELRDSIESYRLSNIYNIADSTRQFLLKFNKPDSKINVVVDCGLKFHITEYTRPTPPVPSGFVVKLRKHLKAKRLTAVRQVSNDRIVVLQFAEGKNYLVLEFFSAGNVILLDEDLKILSLQRIVKEHENKVGEKYEMFDQSLFDRVVPNHHPTQMDFTKESVKSWFEEELEFLKSSKINEKKRSIHRLLLSKAPYLSSDLLSKNLKQHNIKSSEPSSKYFAQEDLICEILQQTQEEYSQLIESKSNKGYIVKQKNPNFIADRDQADLEYVFDSFHPFKPYLNETENKEVLEVDGTYNKTLDIFFSTVESSKYALKIQAQEQIAQKKLDDARSENVKRIQALEDIQSENERKGNLIIYYADQVEEAKEAVQGLIDQQLDWSTIEKLIKTEQKKKNHIAEMIKLPLKLEQNKIDIILVEQLEYDSAGDSDSSDTDSDSSDNEDGSEEEGDGDFVSPTRVKKIQKNNLVVVTIDLSLSAYANASQYFSLKKSTVEKQKKVEQNIGMAMKNIEKKVNQQLKKKLKESHDVLKKLRTPYFFEKYYWFISSEGFLVMMGKSAIETDQIYSRYIEDEDIFVSNNYSKVVWIKNPEKTEVPPNTLMQAGIFCMSSSETWSKKVAESAWWCPASNTSKFSAHDNTVLPDGVFRLKDEKAKNTLAPSQLVMGLGLLWKIKETDEPEAELETKDDDTIEDNMEMNPEHDGLMKGTNNVDEFSRENGGNDSTDENTVDLSDVLESKDEQPDTETVAPSTISDIVDNMKKNVRGKKGKLKKIQRKYKDQDEDERLIRLEALGTLKGIEKKERQEQEDIAKQNQREFRKARRERQKESQALKFTSNEKVKVDYSRSKDELTMSLSPEDEVFNVVPVFAPWPALLKYKYKVKIQPGNAKKTKSINEILNFFLKRDVDKEKLDKEKDWPNEHDMIKGLTAQEMVLLLSVDKVNLSLPGSQNGKSNKQAKGKNSKGKVKGKNKKK